jgi:DNA repair protein RadC
MPKLSTQLDDVHVIREVHLHYSQDHQEHAPLTDSADVADFLRRVVRDTTREHAVAIYLDPKNRPLGWRIVSIGTDVMAPVKPLLVLQPAVLLGANAMIFAHNHPSGDLEPSAEDTKLAETLCAACTLLGLRLLDNIIWTEAGCTSYGPYARESGGVR